MIVSSSEAEIRKSKKTSEDVIVSFCFCRIKEQKEKTCIVSAQFSINNCSYVTNEVIKNH